MSSGEAGFQPGGDILSRYRLQDRIGEGELGVVYRAEQIQSSEVVAAKFLRTCRNRDHVQAVLEELGPLVDLEHKHLVRLVDIGKEGVPCLVYEHLQGASLARLLTKHERLAPAAALRILKGLSDGLAALHAKGFVHGAIRTSNVLLDRQGKAKLSDVGWSRLATLAEAEEPPPPLDPKSEGATEVKRLGELLFEMLVGRPPEGASALSGNLAGVPDELDAVVKTALSGGYADAPALKAAVKGLLEQKSIGGRKTAYDTVAARVVESGTRPPPVVDGGGDLGTEKDAEAERRRRSDVLRAVGGAKTHQKPRIPGLKVDVGQRTGPTMAQLVLVVLTGLGVVGGLAYYSMQELEKPVDRPDHVGMGGSGGPKTGGQGDLSGSGIDAGNVSELTRAIIEEARLKERILLVQKLLKSHPGKAPDALTNILKGGNERIRGQLLPFLVTLDRDGERRITLLRFASEHDTDWPLKLTLSLTKAGMQTRLRQTFESRKGPGAMVALAGSTWGAGSLPLELASRYEQIFLSGDIGKRKQPMGRWVTASGGGDGPVAQWLASKLLSRVTRNEDRVEILEVLGGLEPSARLLEALSETVGRLGYNWGDEAMETSFGAMRVHAGGDPASLQEIDALQKKVRGY